MNIESIDLNLLRVFESVYSERNLSRAAKRLGLNQSSVSNALARLRDALGQSIFVRSGHGVIPTPFADSIAVDVNRALALLRNALRDPGGFDFASSDRRFGIICSDYSAAVIMPRLLSTLQTLAPHISLVVLNLQNGDDIAPAIANGEADLAIGNLTFLSMTVRHQRLFDDNYLVLARKGHPATKGAWDANTFLKYPQILVNPYNPYTRCAPWCDRDGSSLLDADPKVAVHAPSFLAVPYLLATSDCLAACPGRLAHDFVKMHPLQILEAPFPKAPVSIGQYWHERQHNDVGHRWLREQIYRISENM
ncbi:MAG TPA: LysR family transcriptional regulator [Burkholderiaceae bacterium]|jgi:DNA-binding transcriptional LysR family regulator